MTLTEGRQRPSNQAEGAVRSAPGVAPRGGAGRRSRGKMAVPLLSILAALSMGVAAIAIVFQMQERDKRQARERELALVQAEFDDLQVQFEAATRKKAELEAEVERLRTEFEGAKRELAQAIEAQAVLSEQVEAREKELGRVTQDLEQQRKQRKQLADELKGLQAERDEVERKLAEAQEAKAQLEDQFVEASDRPTVELEKVLVTSEELALGGVISPVSQLVPALPNGEVVVVNREYDFIVMNLGRNDGLTVGQEFRVVRGNEVLGRVKVEKVYDELSAAAILPESQEDNIREGDTVTAL